MSTPNLKSKTVSVDTVQFKIVADDASKAVNAIKQKFGDSAKVIAVKQQVSNGIAGILKSPRLEIVVEVPTKKKPGAAKTAGEGESKEEISVEKKMPTDGDLDAKSRKPSSKNPIASLYNKTSEEVSSDGYFSSVEDGLATGASPRLGSAANPVRRGTIEYVERAVSMLRSVGFDDSMVERICCELEFREMEEVPNLEIYSRICDWLRNQFPDAPCKLKGDCRAFIGASGVGKTSALSKALSADVFINGLEPVVLKVDGSVPNPSDGLEAFCEIMGAPLYRSLDEVEERSSRKPIYADLPGLNLGDADAVDSCRELLDEMGADERILVVNAAYETESISDSLLAGNRMGATHVVFTHLDETRKAGKLWKFVLGKSVYPLFFSHGPNPAGDYTVDPFSYLLEKIFPRGRELASARRNVPRGSVENSKSEEMATA